MIYGYNHSNGEEEEFNSIDEIAHDESVMKNIEDWSFFTNKKRMVKAIKILRELD